MAQKARVSMTFEPAHRQWIEERRQKYRRTVSEEVSYLLEQLKLAIERGEVEVDR